MFQIFKPNNDSELNIYKYVESYISSIQSKLEKWVKNNKYKNYSNYNGLFATLTQIEMNIRYLEKLNDRTKTNELSKLYYSLEVCLIKIYNKLLEICEITPDDNDLVDIAVELIKLRGIVNRNINIPGIKNACIKYSSADLLRKQQYDLFDRMKTLESQIFIRKQQIATTEIRFSKK